MILITTIEFVMHSKFTVFSIYPSMAKLNLSFPLPLSKLHFQSLDSTRASPTKLARVLLVSLAWYHDECKERSNQKELLENKVGKR